MVQKLFSTVRFIQLTCADEGHIEAGGTLTGSQDTCSFLAGMASAEHERIGGKGVHLDTEAVRVMPDWHFEYTPTSHSFRNRRLAEDVARG